MKPDDILLWQDGFWCYRSELDRRFLRNNYYRAIPRNSDEGRKIIAERSMRRLQLDPPRAGLSMATG
jgi:hypothetical protein